MKKMLDFLMNEWVVGATLLLIGLHQFNIIPFFGRDNIGRSEETRLNSSHITISYAVFCLKKKKTKKNNKKKKKINKTKKKTQITQTQTRYT